MKGIYNNINEIRTRIEELEELQKNNNEINIDMISELEESLNAIEGTENSVEYLLRHKLLKLKKYSLRDTREKLTKWDLFVNDIDKVDGLEKVKELVAIIDEKKDETITKEELQTIEKMYAEILPELHTNMKGYERDRAIKEFNKKIKLFTNRLSRVIEEDFGAWIKQLRLQKGYSLKELESISGVTASYIHRIESGSRKTPSVPIAERLAIGLGLSPDEFLKRLNIASTGESIRDELPLAQALAVTPFTVNNEKATTAQKNVIIELINKVMSVKWSNETKVTDSIEVMALIDNFKKTIPYCENKSTAEVAIDNE